MQDNKSETLSQTMLRDLDSFSMPVRLAALRIVAALLRDAGGSRPGAASAVNVHAHTFHSYSCVDYSPSRLVWEAARSGLAVIGSTDFDVLNAMPEMYLAGSMLGIPTTVSLETRTFVESYADREINSPGEPGVMYVMGAGFTTIPGPDTLFPSLAEQSRRRNLEMVAKVNQATRPVEIDYYHDVLPLTPSGNATERHLCAAYDAKARSVFPDRSELASYWAGLLGLSPEKAETLLNDAGGLRNAIRGKLMKKGGAGYTQPGKDTFPPVEDFFRMVREAGAVPCLAWLDGMSAGEVDPARLLDDALSWGARCVNIIPDRNWNIADPDVKQKKLAALAAFVEESRKRHLPILAGTEMNSPGQKFVDSFDAPELAPYVADFRDGAYWLYGHTVMARLSGMGASSAWNAETYGDDRARSNAFYTRVGRNTGPAKLAVGA